MNKLTLSLILLLFCVFAKAQNDTTRVSPPKPDSTQAPDNSTPATPTSTPTVTPSQPTNTVTPTEPNRKRPKAYNDYVNKGTRPVQTTPFMDNVYFGCNLYLRYYAYGNYGGNVLDYDVSPHAGYKFNDVLSAGVQIIYHNTVLHQGSIKSNYNIFGTGIFGRALLLNRFFLQVEYDILSVPASYLGNAISTRQFSDEKMAGIGYKSPLGDKLSYFVVIMYDINPTLYSPYYSYPLVYRAGLVYNF